MSQRHDYLKAAPDAKQHEYQWLASYPQDVKWDATFEPVVLVDLLERAAASFPGNVCTDFFGRCLTYKEVRDKVDAVAASLQSAGLKKGAKVGLFLPNSPTYLIYYYAVLKAGGVVVNYNPLYTVDELSFQIIDSETELLVTLDLHVLMEKVEGLLAQGVLSRAIVCSFPALLPGTKSALFKLFRAKELARPKASEFADRLITEEEFLDRDAVWQPVEIDPHEDLAVLQYTGGTTGTPKGVMLTHANVSINAQQVAAWAPHLVDGEERVMGILPFFHVFAMTVVVNFAVVKAARILIMPKFVLNDALKLIHTKKPTTMPAVPTLFNAIMHHPRISSFDLSSLKLCISGGAPLPIEVKERFEKLTGCQVVEGYGLSEAAPVVTCNVSNGLVRSGSIGLPFPATIVSLRDLDDPTREVPLGEKGEICVKGPQVMGGYWRRPDATAEVFVDGFLRTGDVARMDEDGMIYIEDRIKDLIICSGYNVYPRQVEEAIYTHAAVEEVTVIGIPDDYRGEAPKAFVKLVEGAQLSGAELLEHLKTKLSKIELPAEIEFRDALPKTMIGKLSKKELKAEEMEKRGERS